MKIECKHWEDCGSSDGGCCTIGEYERPSFGVCLTVCKSNTSKKQSMPERIIKKAKSYIRAESSLANEGEVDEGVYNHRIELCKSCDDLKKTWDEVGHCGACGCGTGRRSALTVKCKMPKATCPKNKWKN